MKKLIFFFICLMPVFANAQDDTVKDYEDEVFTVPQPRGLNTDDNPIFLNKGQFMQTPDAQNVVTDETVGIKPRAGFTNFSTQTGSDMWVFYHSTKNNTYNIIQSSNRIIAASNGGINFNIGAGTVNPNVTTVASQLGDRLYFMNTSDGLSYWNTDNEVRVSTNVNGNLLATHKGRLWAGGIVGDERTIYVSEFLNGSNFTLAVDPTDTSPARIQVQGREDDSLQVLYGSYFDKLIWFKNNSFGGITGNRRGNFETRAYSETVGTQARESVQNCDGFLRWLGRDKKVYEYNGAKYYPITTDIDTLMDTVVQGNADKFSHTYTSEQDFAVGIFGQRISSTMSSGDLVWVAVTTVTDTFSDSNFSSNPSWTTCQGSFTIDSNNSLTLYTPYNRSILATNSSINVGTWTFRSFGLRYPSESIYYFMGNEQCGSNGYAIRIGDQITGKEVQLARYPGPTVLISSVVAFSILDGGFSNRVAFEISRSESGVFRLSRNGFAVFMGSATDTTYSDSSFITINVSDDSRWGLTEVSFAKGEIDFNNSTYTFTPINVGRIGTDVEAWGVFEVNAENGGNIGYRVFTDSWSNINAFNNGDWDRANYAAPNQIVPLSGYLGSADSQYIIIRATFSREFSSNTVTLHDITWNWNKGSPLRAASSYRNNNYWLGVAISSDKNNRVLVYDKNRDWHRYTGINMDASILWDSKRYFINGAGTFLAESGKTDNGTSINAYYRTPDFTFGNLNNRKTFIDLYMTTTNNAGTLETDYYVDGVNTAFALNDYTMNSESGLQDFRLPFPMTQLVQGKTLSLLWTVNGTSDWSLLSGTVYFDMDSNPSD